MPGWLKTIFHVIGVAIEATAKAIAVAAKFLATKAWAALRFVGRKFVDFGRAVGGAFEKLWHAAIKPALHALAKFAHNLWQFLREWANKILNVLRHAYHILDVIFNRYIRPLLAFIDRIRSVLQLLARLGVKWAAALDAILGKIEWWIYSAFEAIRGKLNQLINIINIVLDPRLLIRANVLLASIHATAGGVWGVLVDQGVIGSKGPRWDPPPARDARNEKEDIGTGVTMRSVETGRGLVAFHEMLNYLL